LEGEGAMAITEDDYRAQDAIGLAGLIAGGQITAAEALEAALARSAKVNPKINAITLDLADRARREVAAKAPTGPLAGVPFLLKDLGPKLAGTATTDSCKLYADDVAEADSPLTSLYKAAGHGTFAARRAARPAARPRRWRRGSCRSRTPATAAARSASRPPAAACSG
jgi:Asp-tRNA(Asn)/Glu-tRNA(Gln) amidotransferase A subunit family amidase